MSLAGSGSGAEARVWCLFGVGGGQGWDDPVHWGPMHHGYWSHRDPLLPRGQTEWQTHTTETWNLLTGDKNTRFNIWLKRRLEIPSKTQSELIQGSRNDIYTRVKLKDWIQKSTCHKMLTSVYVVCGKFDELNSISISVKWSTAAELKQYFIIDCVNCTHTCTHVLKKTFSVRLWKYDCRNA